MIHNRRSPLLAGLGAGAAPAFYGRPVPPGREGRPVGVVPAQSAPAATVAPTPAQVATAHREALRPRQVFEPRKELFTDEARFSPDAAAAAQERFERFASEFQALFRAGGAGYPGAQVSEDLPPMNDTAKARAAFITWLRTANPEAYNFAMQQARSGNGLSDTAPNSGFDWQKFIEAATAATTAVFQTKAQKDMLKVNIERAKAGLPPMDSSFAAPVIRTQFDVSPEIARELQQSAQRGLNTVLLVGGGLALLFFMARR